MTTDPRFEDYLKSLAVEWLETFIQAMEEHNLRLLPDTFVEVQGALDRGNFDEIRDIIRDLEDVCIELDEE